MSTDKTRLEIAHVLFIDIVGYSKLLLKQQSELLRELNEIVSGTKEFRQAESAGKLIRLPTGDGMALCVLAMIDAGLGRKEQALEEGRRAIALTPMEKDVNNGSLVIQYFAITAAWAGEKELALQQLETGLRAPVASQLLSYGVLKPMPFWDPLRGDPRFEQIAASLAPKEYY